MKRKLINRILGSVLVFLMVGTASGSAALAVYHPDDDSFHRKMGGFQGEETHSDSTHNTPTEWPADARSTTELEPPRGLIKGKSSLELDYQVVIPDVPAYLWYRGCGPTTAGMVIGYWDGNGFDDLVTGNADTQTADVDNMISSSGNYDDYCFPVDSYPNLLDDKSELPVGDEHPDDSAADFMKTSQSYHNNYYGWSWLSYMDESFRGYMQRVAPQYEVTVYNAPWGQFTWDSFRAEIDANNPVVLLVDTDANGGTDHFVTAIGYGEVNGTPMYVCRNTWDADYSNDWYEFAQMSVGQPWGIYGATILNLRGPVDLRVSSTAGGSVITPGEGTFTYNTGDTVNLIAVPEAGRSFSHWSGDAAVSDPTTTVIMDGNKDATANFTLDLAVLEVETAIGEEKDMDGVAVITVSIASVKDPSTGETVPGVQIAGYSASLTHTPTFMEILEIRGGDTPFNAIPAENIVIDNGAGTASVSYYVSPSGTLPSIIVFHIVARLNDSSLVNDNLTVNVAEASDSGGIVMSAQNQPMVLALQRGDNSSGNIGITNALYGAQYIVGIKTVHQINLLNVASVQQNSPGDKASITDCLYIAQHVIGIKNEHFQ